MSEPSCKFVMETETDPRQWLRGLAQFLTVESSRPKYIDQPVASLAFGEWGRRVSGLADMIRPVESALGDTKPEHERLREALTWAVGFIECQMPKVQDEYPDMRNAQSLIQNRGLSWGEFRNQCNIAEFAEEAMQQIQDVLDNRELSWPVKEYRIQKSITVYNELVHPPSMGSNHVEKQSG